MGRIRARSTRILPAFFLLLSRPAFAQQADFVCDNTRLRAGLVLRVSVYSPQDTMRGSVVGPMVSCADGYLVLGLYPGQDDPAFRVPTHAIHRLWLRDDAGSLGLVVGAGLGASSGAAIAAVRSSLCSRGSPPVQSTCHGDIVGDALIGMLVGGILGHLLGSGFPHWKRITFEPGQHRQPVVGTR